MELQLQIMPVLEVTQQIGSSTFALIMTTRQINKK